ncbi:hypothetical protein DHEL01_v201634 [Diaporthe helianthi]|uniref:Uncharacterized protein n=1 Tax=Diaporthe helianthi TaxID=158607 RepID=A0A2P5IBV9_DIAHE|nr:hypothetical protein DHEL01_v201634 [Diaporthe helianthi]
MYSVLCVVLNYTQRISPKVLHAEVPGQLYSVLDGRRELVFVYITEELGQIRFGGLQPTPISLAVARSDQFMTCPASPEAVQEASRIASFASSRHPRHA